MALGVLTSCLLQWLSDYSNTFRLTNKLTCGRGFLHRSLLCSLVEEGEHEKLRAVLEGIRSDTKEAVRRRR